DKQQVSTDSQLWVGLVNDYEDELAAVSPGSRKRKYQEMNEEVNPRLAWLNWAMTKYADLCDPDRSQRFRAINEALVKDGFFTDLDDVVWDWTGKQLKQPADTPEKARLAQYIGLMRKYGPVATHQEAMVHERGHGFRRLETLTQVPAWTDDFADVMRVM